MDDVRAEYQRRKSAWEAKYGRAGNFRRLLLALLIVSVALFGLAFYQGVRNATSLWWLIVPAAAVGILAPWEYRKRKEAHRTLQLLVMYESGLARLDGQPTENAETGEAFAEPGHLYDRDLHVLGEHSLFRMLATTRTILGQESLAQMLLHHADFNTVKQRQEAVRELLPQLELRERVEVLADFRFDQARPGDFKVWLQHSGSQLPPRLPIWLAMATCLWVGALGFYLFGGIHSSLTRNIALSGVAVQAFTCLSVRREVMEELQQAQKLPEQVRLLREGLRLLSSTSFESSLLRRMQKETQEAIGALDELCMSLAALEQRGKEWFYIVFLSLGIGTHLAVYFQSWKFRHQAALERWLTGWGAFDALSAVATYAREHPANAWPEIVKDEVVFSAVGLAHPLLPAHTAVTNDVHLGDTQPLLLISGSNMAGKSTLLRAIGCNMLLAFCGATVCARSMRVGAMQLGASLALVDSLADGRSKFLAEVERLRDLAHLAQAADGRMLFLIDEILSGTNSDDRRIAAEAVMKTLISTGAIGALSTHDLALTRMIDEGVVRGVNVHMASTDPDNPLAFDYQLKPGVNEVTNGLAIVEMLGFSRSIKA